MSYTLELPRDVETDIDEWLAQFTSGTAAWIEARDGIIGALRTLEVNPRIGSRVYGGPAERRQFYRFRVEVVGEAHDLQLAYVLNERQRLITAHGFAPVPTA